MTGGVSVPYTPTKSPCVASPYLPLRLAFDHPRPSSSARDGAVVVTIDSAAAAAAATSTPIPKPAKPEPNRRTKTKLLLRHTGNFIRALPYHPPTLLPLRP